MASDPFIPFYPSDWLAGTRGLTAAETGIYITLIMMMYEREEPLEIAEARLARLCGSTVTNFRKAVRALIHEGKISVDGGLWNTRVERELRIRTAKRENARATALQRWGKTERNQRDDDADAERVQCEADANQNPKSRESAGGGTRAPACVAVPPGATPLPAELNEREEALIAMGHDPTGMTATGRVVGGVTDMEEKRRWSEDLGLSHDQQIGVIREIVTGKRDGPPVSFRYFTPAMQRLAAVRQRKCLEPAQPGTVARSAFHSVPGGRRETQGEKQQCLHRVISAAAAGTTQTEWG